MELTKEEEAYIKEQRKAEREWLIREAREMKERFSKFMVRVEKFKPLITEEGVSPLGWKVMEASSGLSRLNKEIEEIEVIKD